LDLMLRQLCSRPSSQNGFGFRIALYSQEHY
jgi:hypothetical protein